MKLFILISAFIAAQSCFAKGAFRELGAHVHGNGTLSIAFDANQGRIEFKGAAEGILGFEHQPRTAKDKKTVAEAVAHFENDIGKMVAFEPSLNCQFKKEMIGQVPEAGHEGSGEHSDWAANFSVHCNKSPLGTKLAIDFGSFKLLRTVSVAVLVEAVQKSAELRDGKPVSIDLKP